MGYTRHRGEGYLVSYSNLPRCVIFYSGFCTDYKCYKKENLERLRLSFWQIEVGLKHEYQLLLSLRLFLYFVAQWGNERKGATDAA
jgi:hypothetical protein